jgi:hypothetical protein
VVLFFFIKFSSLGSGWFFIILRTLCSDTNRRGYDLCISLLPAFACGWLTGLMMPSMVELYL